MRRFAKSGIIFMASWFVLLITAYTSSASTITPSSEHSSQISIISGSGSNSDLVTLRKANAAGISWNTFSAFNVSARSLNIVNVGGRTDDASETITAPANLIIIEAPVITLTNTIKLMGASADILFISTNAAGDVICNSCSFENFYRVTLAAARPSVSFTNAMSTVGNLTSSSGGEVSINGLNAPGILSLDILGRALYLSGEMNLNQNASKDSRGGYTLNANGSFLLGTGGVNLLLGQLDWNYESQESVAFYPQGTQQTLGGTIKAVSAKLSSSEPVTVNTTIDTRTNVLSSVRYRNRTQVSQESVTLQTIGKPVTPNWLVVKGAINSDGTVAIQSNDDLTLDTPASISAPHIQLLARNDLFNFGRIEGDKIDVASNTVLNRGSMESFASTEIWAQYNVFNNFGGAMIGPDVVIESELGIVRNGSRFPYLVEANEESATLNTQNEMPGADYDMAHIGTFYRDDIFETVEANRIRPDDTSSFILARDLSIKARAIENINPYWEVVDSNGSVTIDLGLVAQVTMSGLDSMTLEAVNYVLNSSAIIRTELASSLLQIKAPILANERYRTLNSLEKLEQGTTLGFVTKTVTYSPPGFLISMGDFELDATDGAFVNELSYFEVFGNADLKTSSIKDVGLEQGGVISTDVTVYNQQVLQCQRSAIAKGGWLSGYFYSKCGNPTSTAQQITIPDVDAVDSLFFVHGDLRGYSSDSSINESTFLPETYNALDYYIDLAAQMAIEREFASVGEEGRTYIDQIIYPTQYGFITWGDDIGTKYLLVDYYHNSSVEDDILEIGWTKSYVESHFSTMYSWDVLWGTSSSTRTWEEEPEVFAQGSKTLSLIEELEKLWNTITSWFSELIIDWWGEE